MPQLQQSALIAGSVLPIKRAEELLATLPGVIAARIIAGDNGAVDEIHVLTTAELTPKPQRACYDRLLAHCGFDARGSILIEDTLHNLEPAHDMGFATALVGVVHPEPRPPYLDHWAPDVKALLRLALDGQTR